MYDLWFVILSYARAVCRPHSVPIVDYTTRELVADVPEALMAGQPRSTRTDSSLFRICSGSICWPVISISCLLDDPPFGPFTIHDCLDCRKCAEIEKRIGFSTSVLALLPLSHPDHSLKLNINLAQASCMMYLFVHERSLSASSSKNRT